MMRATVTINKFRRSYIRNAPEELKYLARSDSRSKRMNAHSQYKKRVLEEIIKIDRHLAPLMQAASSWDLRYTP